MRFKVRQLRIGSHLPWRLLSNALFPVDGVRVAFNSTGAAAVILDVVSEELKLHLRDRLAAFCYGGKRRQRLLFLRENNWSVPH